MSKKSFLVILGLSVSLVYLQPYLNLIGNFGLYGFPLRYGSSSFFGGSSFEWTPFLIDVVVWYLFLLVIWRLIRKVL